MTRIDTLEEDAFKVKETGVIEKMDKLNKFFKSEVVPNAQEIYGVKETLLEGGGREVLWKNAENHIVKQYFSADDKLIKQRLMLGNHRSITQFFDDNGHAYLTSEVKLKENTVVRNERLTPKMTIKMDNFTAETDELGRLILGKLEHAEIKDGMRLPMPDTLSQELKDLGYEQGHLIPDKLNGPTNQANLVPQNFKINRGDIKRAENIAVDLTKEGHDVNYEMKVNYVGKDNVPTSFEPKITVDGKVYDLDTELKKIYNHNPEEKFSGFHNKVTDIRETYTKIREKYAGANQEGLHAGLAAAGLTAAVSSYENVSQYLDHQISGDEMAVNIVKDTGAAFGMGYGQAFIEKAAVQSMEKSSSALIQKTAGTALPAAAVSFAVDSYGDIRDFCTGDIDGEELAYNLGNNAAEVAGGALGGAAAGAVTGAVLGSVAGPVGTAAGFAAGLAGSAVGCAIASEAYKSAVELGSEGAEVLGARAEQFAADAVRSVEQNMPDKLSDIKEAFNNYASENSLPFHFN